MGVGIVLTRIPASPRIRETQVCGPPSPFRFRDFSSAFRTNHVALLCARRVSLQPGYCHDAWDYPNPGNGVQPIAD
jgi:hypothetical protein